MNLLNLDILQVNSGGNPTPLPSWAKAAIEIGSWTRQAAVSSQFRLIVCCVVPCREVFTALVGLGAVASGGALFRKGFSWTDFLDRETETEIFWSAPGINQKLAGILREPYEVNNQQMRPVKITKGPKKMHGTIWSFTETRFRECIFSEERLPSNTISKQFARAGHFYSSLGIPTDSPWLMTAGAEVRFIVNRTAFKRALGGWELISGSENESSPVDQLLILRDEGDSALAKARVSPARGAITSDCPVSVLDGPLAFQRIPDIETGSLVVVLERNELAEEHRDLLIQARHEHSLECEQKHTEFLPSNIPATVEVTGYCLRAP